MNNALKNNLLPIFILGFLSALAYGIWELWGGQSVPNAQSPNWVIFGLVDAAFLAYGFLVFNRQAKRFSIRLYQWLGWAMIGDVIMESYLVPVYHNSPKGNLLCVAAFLLVGLGIAGWEKRATRTDSEGRDPRVQSPERE